MTYPTVKKKKKKKKKKQRKNNKIKNNINKQFTFDLRVFVVINFRVLLIFFYRHYSMVLSIFDTTFPVLQLDFRDEGIHLML